MISGDMYSVASKVSEFAVKFRYLASHDAIEPSVPTKLLVRKCAMQVLVSMAGGYRSKQ
jgi:hypothetical protein